MSHCYHADAGGALCSDEDGNPEVCTGSPMEEPPWGCPDCYDSGRTEDGKRCACERPLAIRARVAWRELVFRLKCVFSPRWRAYRKQMFTEPPF